MLNNNSFCKDPHSMQVQTVDGLSISEAGQNVHLLDCFGFICLNKDQQNETCYDYKIRQCCHLCI